MSRLFGASRLPEAARDNAADVLSVAAASVYFLGFLSALQAAIGKLLY